MNVNEYTPTADPANHRNITTTKPTDSRASWRASYGITDPRTGGSVSQGLQAGRPAAAAPLWAVAVGACPAFCDGVPLHGKADVSFFDMTPFLSAA